MYGLKLTLQILAFIQQSQDPLKISEIVDFIGVNLQDFQKNNLRARIIRHVHQLDAENQLKIERKTTILKTEYLEISKL